jgi:hypothetical protein
MVITAEIAHDSWARDTVTDVDKESPLRNMCPIFRRSDRLTCLALKAEDLPELRRSG